MGSGGRTALPDASAGPVRGVLMPPLP